MQNVESWGWERKIKLKFWDVDIVENKMNTIDWQIEAGSCSE